MPQVTPPGSGDFPRELVAKGAELAAVGNCVTCHTASDGKPYAGGYPLQTPFGIVYATNITPDTETGIGRWSQDAFARAMREGVDREGRHLYPAFPYDHFTKTTDEDIRALYASVMTREPVRAHTPANTVSIPRPLVALWKAMCFEPGVYRADPARDPRWNRGAYLAEGLAHCGACHTPRNRLGAEKKRESYAGGEVGGWHAPALNASTRPSTGPDIEGLGADHGGRNSSPYFVAMELMMVWRPTSGPVLTNPCGVPLRSNTTSPGPRFSSLPSRRKSY